MKKTVKILLAWVLALVCVMTVPGMSVAAATAAQKEEAQVSEEVLEEVSEDVTEEREETAEEVTEEATEEETEEVSEEVTEETTEKVAEETAEETTEEAVEEVTEEATEEVTEEVTEEETKETEIEEIGRKDADVDEKGLKSEETEREVIPDAGILGDPQTVTATIKVDGSYTAEIKSPGEIKYYKFVPTADGTYVLTSTAEMDTYGHLYDADWDQIATNDDGGSNGNFRLSYQMTAGTTYYYGVRFYSTYDTGSIPFNLTKVKTGWNQVGDDWYYVLEDGNNAQGFLEINGKTYYFDYNGKMMTNYAAYKYEDGEQKYFWLGSNGVLYTKTGWFTYNNYGTEYRYYVQDSTGRLAYGWTELNGTRYYFGPSMASNGSREIYDQSSETYKHYFFTENGALVTKIGWVKTSYGDWFYVKDTSGELYSNELVTIGSKQYYFGYSGRMTVDSSFTIGEKPYVADGNGYVTELKAGWNKAGDNYYYLKDDGTIAKSEVLKIGSYYYGFGYAGIMYDDTTFSFYNSGNYYYYRAKAGGKLYVNAWYKTEYGEWYYYGAEGKGADGIETVGGKQYYFSSARMITNDLFYYEGSTYYANSSGELQLLKEGWNLVHVEHEYDDYAEDRYCYVAEGSFFSHQVAKIGSDWYGFNYEGWMYEDETFSMGSDSTSVYYRAKANGKLYVNSWYQEGENWYYYGEGGAAPSGLFTVSGKQYLFNYRGLMCVNRYQPSGDYLYYADAKGAATKVTKDGLYRGGGIYYVQGGRIFKGGWKTVDGKSYFFNSAGQAYTRRNGTVQIDGKCYLFNDDGVMEKGSWIHDYDEVYYAGSDGALYIGEHKIDGQWYYFNSYGRMLTGLVMYNGKLYLCATDGHYIGTAKGNGWNEISGSWYYVENNQLVGYGTKTIGGVMYYFNGGLMMTDSTYDGYVFGSNGKQVKSGWVMMRGVYYYVDSATGKYVTGDKTISGKEYYFVQNGMMFTGERIINDTEKRVYGANGALVSKTTLASGWSLVGGEYYYIKNGKRDFTGWVGNYYVDNGRMMRNTIADGYWVGLDGKYVKTAGFIKPEGNYYYGTLYAKSGGKLAKSEWVKVGSSWYYFLENYRAITGVYVIDGKVYQFDTNGKMLSTLASTVKDGWLKAGNDWAYIVNKQRTNGIQNINGVRYAFNGLGLMMKNVFYGDYDYTSDSEVYRTYYFGSDGKQVTYTGWKQIDSYWYHFNADHSVTEGFRSIGGKEYLLNDDMATGWVRADRHLYQFNSSGVLIGMDTTQNGWVKKNGNWYYVKDGVLIYSGIVTIGGKNYGFDYSGLVSNRTIEGMGGIYFCGSDGVVVKTAGWHTAASGAKYYTDANGKCLTGIQKIGGTTYYFSGYGVLIR